MFTFTMSGGTFCGLLLVVVVVAHREAEHSQAAHRMRLLTAEQGSADLRGVERGGGGGGGVFSSVRIPESASSVLEEKEAAERRREDGPYRHTNQAYERIRTRMVASNFCACATSCSAYNHATTWCRVPDAARPSDICLLSDSDLWVRVQPPSGLRLTVLSTFGLMGNWRECDVGQEATLAKDPSLFSVGDVLAAESPKKAVDAACGHAQSLTAAWGPNAERVSELVEAEYLLRRGLGLERDLGIPDEGNSGVLTWAELAKECERLKDDQRTAHTPDDGGA